MQTASCTRKIKQENSMHVIYQSSIEQNNACLLTSSCSKYLSHVVFSMDYCQSLYLCNTYILMLMSDGTEANFSCFYLALVIEIMQLDYII